MKITGTAGLQSYPKYSFNTAQSNKESISAPKHDSIEISEEGREAAKRNSETYAAKSETENKISIEDYLKTLQKQVPYIKLQIGYGININNDRKVNVVDVNPKFIEKMQNDPKAVEEYTQRLKDVENAQKIMNSVTKSMGHTVICNHSYIDENGNFSSFTITVKKDLLNERLRKESQEKTKEWIEKSREKTAEMLKEKMEKSENNEIFLDNDDIQVIIDEAKTDEDEPIEEAEAQETSDSAENTEKSSDEGTFSAVVAFNAAKRARQLAAASNPDQVQTVMDLLNDDLADCKDGLSKGWCDEQEVNKVKAMIQRAKQRMAQVSRENNNEEKDVNSDLAFMIASLPM